MDLAYADELRTALLEECRDVPLAVLDLTHTTFLDSSIMGVIVGAHKRARAEGRTLMAVNAHGIVLKALQITGLDELLRMPGQSDDLDAELRALLS